MKNLLYVEFILGQKIILLIRLGKNQLRLFLTIRYGENGSSNWIIDLCMHQFFQYINTKSLENSDFGTSAWYLKNRASNLR